MNPLPKFPVGFKVNVGYMGLYRADEQPTDRGGAPVRLDYRVVGLRYVPEGDEVWDEEAVRMKSVLTYPKGWEYLIERADQVSPTSGWVPEAILVENGYMPPEEVGVKLPDWMPGDDYE